MTVLFKSWFRIGSSWKDKWEQRDIPPGTTAERCIEDKPTFSRIGISKRPDGSIITGKIVSRFEFTYGFVQARMRFLGPRGGHACVWSQAKPPYATPEHTEVDIAEYFGAPRIWQNLYWRKAGQDWDDFHTGSGPGAAKHSVDLDPEEWMTYGCGIYPDGYRFTINGKVTNSIDVNVEAVPRQVLLTYIVDDWEMKDLLIDQLWLYRADVKWVSVEAM